MSKRLDDIKAKAPKTLKGSFALGVSITLDNLWYLIQQAEEAEALHAIYGLDADRLNAIIIKNKKLEKENQELKDEMERLTEESITLKEDLGNKMPVDFEAVQMINLIDNKLGEGWVEKLADHFKQTD